MIPFLAAEEVVTSPTTLLIAGLLSGSGVIALIIKFLIASPERETAAYRQGALDEKSRTEEEIKELRKQIINQYAEIANMRTALLRLAVATELSQEQRREISNILGFKTSYRLKNEYERELGEER